MRKLLSLLLSFCLVCGICGNIVFAENSDDLSIYSDIYKDFCNITDLTKAEADVVFSNIENYSVAQLSEVEENNQLFDSTNNAKNTIIFIQKNYDEIIKDLGSDEIEKLNQYLLYISIEFYKDAIEENDINLKVANEVEGNAVPVAQSIIESNEERQIATRGTNSTVAKLKIFSDPSESNVGSSWFNIDVGTHAWIVVENLSSNNIVVGKMEIAPGTQIAVGTWGNKSEHRGVWYNLEPYMSKYNSAYTNRVSTSCELTSSELTTLSNYIKSHDSWSELNNCSSFAVDAWNEVADVQLSAGIINTPKNLAQDIIEEDSNYLTGEGMRYFYVVHYAQGYGTPVASMVYTRTD